MASGDRPNLVLLQGGRNEPPQSGGRMAGDFLGALLDGSTYTNWGGALGRRMPLGRFGVPAVGLGAAGLGGILAAASELNNPDPLVSGTQRAAGAAGGGLGATGGAVLGGVLGAPLGPIGSLIGGSIGSALGGSLGGAAGRTAAGIFEPSAEQKAIDLYKKQSQAALETELMRANALAPMQQKMAQFATQNEVNRARQLATIQGMSEAFRNQQLASSQQSLAATQGLFAGLGF